MADERYFNVPIALFSGFLSDSDSVLSDVCNYALYVHSLSMEYGEDEEAYFAASANYFKVTLGNQGRALKRGMALYKETPENGPKVGINLSIFWDYLQNHKSDFDKVCLLAYLALKSILQKKSYCKIDNRFLWARMDGRAKACNAEELSEGIMKYANEYQTKKIKNALANAWGLITYSRYTRGFYVSFSMSLEDLVFEAEKKRESVKEKQRKAELDDAIKKAFERLGKTRP